MKSLYILLTRSRSLPSRVIGLFTSEPFTHVSLAFDRELTVLYSFVRKYSGMPLPAGLMEEHLDRGFYRRQGDIPCALLRMDVPDRIYSRAKTFVYNMFQRREEYSYSIFGLLLCHLQISLNFRNRYFCSQFVGTVLAESGALELPKPASLMHPFDFCSLCRLEVLYLGGLDGLFRQHKTQV